MKSRIVAIRNARGIRLPEKLLETTGLAGEVAIEVSGDALFIRPVARPRAGWVKAFRKLPASGKDAAF